jgi:OOP family OmpA-OmpF porin
MRRAAAAALMATLVGSIPSATLAQTEERVPSLDLRNFFVPTDPQSLLTLEPASAPGPGNWNVGAWASYALSPIVVTDATGNERDVVRHQASIDYLVNVGLGSRFALGLVLPMAGYQTGDDVADVIPGAEELPRTALGDVSLAGKATLVSPSDLGGFGLALLGRTSAPTGGPSSYVSEDGFRGGGSILGELSLLAISLRASAGARFRSAPRRLVDDGTDGTEFGHDLPWAVGVTFRPQIIGLDHRGRWRWSVESRGAVALTPEVARASQSPASVSASARYTIDEVSVIAGIEIPLNDAVGNPLIRPVLGIGWAPRFEDEDHDGIEDDADECPELAEDRDGFEDGDGCPDWDDDEDGVGDDQDRCPGQLEDADDFQDEDGCPDPDNDGDGIDDERDKCPNHKGQAGAREPGCPVGDFDEDGVPDDRDGCPEQMEDKDGFEDDDGCPDPDNDADSVPDEEDLCPAVAGAPRPDTHLHGCPSPDRDGDTIDDADDRCPDGPEDFNAVDDGDGCPDESALAAWQQGKPLVRIEGAQREPSLVLRERLTFSGDEVDPRSMNGLRAIAQVLNAHSDWILAVGVRPTGASSADEQSALNRSLSIALTLRSLTYRDDAAEAIGWAAVDDTPGAAKSGVGLLLLVPRREPAAP